eukprot:Gregarina_sp_Poly_1__7352@NODE_405_length_8833_cov_93_710929_g329_i0_p1_GENE_NODE_405_length_8833_cov_93_710929_g329_i0NODE_405_length_8833_cov_93_710929_g329_i0_p1_ORF_typecomplete_len867_score171_36DUF3323/PF11796_8/0_016DUF3323/PF11796_8/2_2e03DUF3323/PF11796_8/7_7e03_NODE_405_length_8833_cov_93_710929_g329_i019944594
MSSPSGAGPPGPKLVASKSGGLNLKKMVIKTKDGRFIVTDKVPPSAMLKVKEGAKVIMKGPPPDMKFKPPTSSESGSVKSTKSMKAPAPLPPTLDLKKKMEAKRVGDTKAEMAKSVSKPAEKAPSPTSSRKEVPKSKSPPAAPVKPPAPDLKVGPSKSPPPGMNLLEKSLPKREEGLPSTRKAEAAPTKPPAKPETTDSNKKLSTEKIKLPDKKESSESLEISGAGAKKVSSPDKKSPKTVVAKMKPAAEAKSQEAKKVVVSAKVSPASPKEALKHEGNILKEVKKILENAKSKEPKDQAAKVETAPSIEINVSPRKKMGLPDPKAAKAALDAKPLKAEPKKSETHKEVSKTAAEAKREIQVSQEVDRKTEKEKKEPKGDRKTEKEKKGPKKKEKRKTASSSSSSESSLASITKSYAKGFEMTRSQRRKRTLERFEKIREKSRGKRGGERLPAGSTLQEVVAALVGHLVRHKRDKRDRAERRRELLAMMREERGDRKARRVRDKQRMAKWRKQLVEGANEALSSIHSETQPGVAPAPAVSTPSVSVSSQVRQSPLIEVNHIQAPPGAVQVASAYEMPLEIFESIQRSEMLTKQLNKILAEEGTPPDKLVEEYEKIADKLQRQMNRSQADHHATPTAFLAFTPDGQCLGKIDPPLELKLGLSGGKTEMMGRDKSAVSGKGGAVSAASPRPSPAGSTRTSPRSLVEQKRHSGAPKIKLRQDSMDSDSDGSASTVCEQLAVEFADTSEGTTSLEELISALKDLKFAKRSSPRSSSSSSIRHSSSSAKDRHAKHKRGDSTEPTREALSQGLKSPRRYNNFQDFYPSSSDESFDEYPSANFLAIAQPGRRRKTHGESAWSDVEQSVSGCVS